METKIIRSELASAAEIIRGGGLVAVPTETVYGLAANGLDEEAVEKIYEVKGRPAVKPLSLMVSGPDDIDKYCVDVPEAARALAKRFWPGPLTIVLRARDIVPEIVRAGGETVGLRCPDHPLTLELLQTTGLPLAAPSANPSEKPSPKDSDKVLEYFDGQIDAVIDGGQCGIGFESTIIDMSCRPYRILRQGALLEKVIAKALSDEMLIVGITGGSGCGKTTALKVLEDFGALILDCDAVYHQLLAENEELLSALDRRFPGTVKSGVLDRKALAAIVFNDKEALEDLNEISHRFIRQETQKRLMDFALSGGKLAGLDAIELIGSGMAKRCDMLIGVLADKEIRVKRIMSRDGIDENSALMRINAQHDDSYFIENCTHILYNNGSAEEFRDAMVNLLMEVI